MNKHISLEPPTPRAAEFEQVLRRHVIDVWFPRSLDREYGGFLCDFDYRWRPCGANEKLLEFQARHTWFAAEASQAYPDDQRLQEAVQHGLAYLRDVLWDSTSGGWFHRLDRAGKPMESDTKHAHGIAYAISACAAVYRATNDQSALDLAVEGFEWLDRYAHDPEHGGYFGYLRRDGSVIQGIGSKEKDTTGTPLGCKDINVHSDLLETFTYLYRTRPDEKLAERLNEATDIVGKRMSTPFGAHFHFCLPDWTPVPHLTQFGYEFQSAYRLASAAPFLGDNGDILLMARRFADHALRYGADRKRGGIYYADVGLQPNRLEGHRLTVPRKLWWVQVEALKSLLTMHSIAPEPRYLQFVNTQWRYIRDHLIDPNFGGFYLASLEELPRWRRISPYFAPHLDSLKGSDWKDCSHEGRALLFCISILKDREATHESAPRQYGRLDRDRNSCSNPTAS